MNWHEIIFVIKKVDFNLVFLMLIYLYIWDIILIVLQCCAFFEERLSSLNKQKYMAQSSQVLPKREVV